MKINDDENPRYFADRLVRGVHAINWMFILLTQLLLFPISSFVFFLKILLVVRYFQDLHAHRVQGMVFGADETTAPEAMFEERVLEDELNLQLHLLQSQEPESYLFPEDNVKMDVVEKTDEPIQKLHSMEVAEHRQELDIEKEVFLLEELAEEGVLESLAICGLIAMLMVAPAFFH